MADIGTGVTVGSRTARVLQVRRDKSGAWSVARALIAPHSGQAGTDARRVAEARAAVQSAQAKGRALVGLTGRDLIVRYTQVPPVPDWRLEMLMDFEIQEVSEQSGGDVSAAYTLLDVDDTTTGDEVVLVALAKNGYLKPRLEALKAGGLNVLGGAPRALGAFWAYKENGHLRFDETVLIMHIGHENTDIAIAREGSLLFARNVSGGSKLFTDALVQNLRVNEATAEKMKITKGNLTPRGKARYRDSSEEKIANNLMGVGGHFVSAFNSSVMFAKAQTKVPECSPDRVVLMGSGALLRGLPEYLESNLGLPVELFDPIDELDLSGLPQEQADALRQEQGGIAVTLGLAQMAADPESTRVEVLPPEWKKQRHFVEHTVYMIASAAVLVVALVVAFVASGSAEATASEEVGKLQAVQEDYDAASQEFASLKEKVELLNDEKHRLRRLVAVGPAYQEITDTVQTVLADFPEVFVYRVGGGLKTFQEQDEEGDFVAVERPAVEFSASVQSLGSRTIASAYSEFQSRLKSAITSRPHLEFQEMGGLDSQSHTFKFRVVQRQFPEEAARAAAAADDADAGGEDE